MRLCDSEMQWQYISISQWHLIHATQVEKQVYLNVLDSTHLGSIAPSSVMVSASTGKSVGELIESTCSYIMSCYPFKL